MQTAVRTTIRIRKDLIDQSRLLAFNRDTSLQDVINETLALGFGHISDLDTQQDAMTRIDKFRESLKGKKFNTKKLVEENKNELANRTDKLLRNF